MSDVLVLASILSLVFAVVMAIIASKLLRENRARSAARVHALQDLVEREPVTMAETKPYARVDEFDYDADVADHVDEAIEADDADQDWDRVLGQVRTSPLSERRPPAFARVSADEPNSELRTSAFARASADESNSELSLFETPPHLTPSRRWLWIPATGLVIALGVGGAYTIFSGVFQHASAAADATPTAPSVTGPAAPIELLSLRHSTEAAAPGTFVVTGLVQNPAVSAAIKGVYAVVYLFDAEGRYFASSKAALDVTMLSPGGEAAFTVRVTPSSSLSAADVRRYRVSFQQQDGSAVSHVDKRGTLPEGTTGSAVEAETPPVATPAKPAKRNITARK